jgi:protein-disulfide isomerase
MDLRSAPVPPVGASDYVRGPDGAPVVLFYGDFACPYCAVAHERLNDAPVRVVFRHFALKAKHPRAPVLAAAAEAAAVQGRFWEMHDSLFADQAHIDDPHLWARAEELGIDLDRFEEDRRSAETLDRVRSDLRGAMRAGVATSPTLIVDGRLHGGVPDAELLQLLSR